MVYKRIKQVFLIVAMLLTKAIITHSSLLACHAALPQEENRTEPVQPGLGTIHSLLLQEEQSRHKSTFSNSGDLQNKPFVLLVWVTPLQHRHYWDPTVNHHCQVLFCQTLQPARLRCLRRGTNPSHSHTSFRKCHRKTLCWKLVMHWYIYQHIIISTEAETWT